MSVKRRDFLAGLSVTSAALPLAARAAFARDTPANPPMDQAIARLAIHPALGICRVGNSAELDRVPGRGVAALPR